ncbi:UDP-glucose 4-epimerase [Paraburkholderia sp. J10-1]|uniref:UDP-glucose 4-epimerase n=1 Tax=Paraburkholderia sp. J10-1 TaxID=2805430 RepID=UPI002AB67D6F|nr:UDP-glucose 4-epimerase [Paraburkholderia sp. J10-1]
MSLTGHVDSGAWSVQALTSPDPQGGFRCEVSVTHGPQLQRFSHAFTHHRVFETEREAVLEGLREGMVWIDLKIRHAFEL